MIRVELVETAPTDSVGSMRRYADLIEQAFVSSRDISISRRSIASPSNRQRWIPSAFRTFQHHGSIYLRAGKLGRQPNINLFHVVDGSHGYVVPLLRNRPTVVTVHDLIPAMQSQCRFPTVPPGTAARQIIASALRGVSKASGIICDSESTKRDLDTFATTAAMKSTVVFPPLESGFLPADDDKVPQRSPFVLHIGNNAFYKNRMGVIRTFAAFADDVPHRLIMAGPSPTPELRELVASFQLVDRVDFYVNPTDFEVRRLYQDAALLLFPSVYEGFGWPPLEAMASGCPVVCSDSGSLPEVVGDAALMAKHDDFEMLAAKCRDVLQNADLAQRLKNAGLARAKEFTLGRFRDELLVVYRNAMSDFGSTQR